MTVFENGESVRQWFAENTLRALTTEEYNNTLQAGPGEVQSKIDEARNSGPFSRVKLTPEKVYDPGSTINLKKGVVLDCYGAMFQPSSSYDLIDVDAEARVLGFRADDSQVSSYTNTLVTFDGTDNDINSGRASAPVAEIQYNGTAGEGTVLYVHQNANNDTVSGHIFNLAIRGCGTAIDMHSENSGGWLNENTFRGVLQNVATGWKTRGSGDIVGNVLEGAIIPDGSAGVAHWDLDTGKKNLLRGNVADPGSPTNVWDITGGENNLIDTMTNVNAQIPGGFASTSGNNSNWIRFPMGSTNGRWEVYDPQADQRIMSRRWDGTKYQQLRRGTKVEYRSDNIYAAALLKADSIQPLSASSAPVQSAAGVMATQDGTNWDPLGTGDTDLTFHNGTAHTSPVPITQKALGGSAPTASNFAEGVFVEDSDNPGDVYLITPSGNATQIGT